MTRVLLIAALAQLLVTGYVKAQIPTYSQAGQHIPGPAMLPQPDGPSYPTTRQPAVSATGTNFAPQPVGMPSAHDPSGGNYPGTVRAPSAAVGALPRGTHWPAAPVQNVARAVLNKGELIEPAQVVAIVGGQTILAGDLEAEINQIRSKVEVTDEQFNAQRSILARQILKQRIDRMLVYQDFLRNVPSERHADLMANIHEAFNDKQLASTLEKHDVENVVQLDTKLREGGSSLQRLKRDFAEHVITQQMINQSAGQNKEITHEQMLAYYHEQIEQYEYPAKAEWEELMAEFRHYRSLDTAWQDVAELGNEVLRGAPLDVVALRSEQGPRAENGGMHEWTTQGSLRSRPLDQALFSLPVGKLSQIIRDEDGLHIVRVTRRIDAGRTPFTEAQVEIKETIRQERRKQQLEKYIVQLREDTPVWTIFDEDSDRPRMSNSVDRATSPPR